MPVSQLEWRARKRQNREKGKEEGKREVLWCYFSLDRGERIPENYQPFPSYVQTETCQYLSILKSKNVEVSPALDVMGCQLER